MCNRNLLRFADPTLLNLPLPLLLLHIVHLLILSVPLVLEHLMETIRGNCLAPFVFQEVVLLRRYQIMELSPLQCNPPPSSVLGRLNTGDCRLSKCIPMFTNLTCTKHTSRTLPITWVDSNHSEFSFLKNERSCHLSIPTLSISISSKSHIPLLGHSCQSSVEKFWIDRSLLYTPLSSTCSISFSSAFSQNQKGAYASCNV